MFYITHHQRIKWSYVSAPAPPNLIYNSCPLVRFLTHAGSHRAVWQSFQALYQHFISASQDTKRDSKEKAMAMYSGLAKRLSCSYFVLNLALVFDALVQLQTCYRSVGLDVDAAMALICQFESFLKLNRWFGNYCSFLGVRGLWLVACQLLKSP